MTGKLRGVAAGVFALACGAGGGGDWGATQPEASGGAGTGGLEAVGTGGDVPELGGGPAAPADGGAGGLFPGAPTGGAPETGGASTGGLGGAIGGAGGQPPGEAGEGGAVPMDGGAAGVPASGGAAGGGGGAGDPGAAGAAGEGGAAGAAPAADCSLPGGACTIVEGGAFVGQRCGLVPVEGCGFAQCGGCWPGEYCSLDNWCRRYDEGCVPFGEHDESPNSVVFAPVGKVIRDGSTSVGGGSVCTLLACFGWPPMEQDIATGEVLDRCPVHSYEYGTYWCREDLCPEWPSE